MTTKWLRYNAHLYAKKLHRRRLLQKDIPTNWHKSHSTSYDWFLAFRLRHPLLTLRAPGGLSKQVQKLSIKNYKFVKDSEKVSKNIDMKNQPILNYNCDETGLLSDSSISAKVLLKKGSKQVQKLIVAARGTLTTLLATINASGDSLPPFLIFKENFFLMYLSSRQEPL